jgi:uncharacterized membrane protein
MNTMKKIILLLLVVLSSVNTSFAQEAPLVFETDYVHGEVLRKDVTGEFNDLYQYETRLSSGAVISFESVETNIDVGDKVYLEHFLEADEYVFTAVDRTVPLLVILGLFILLVLVLTRNKGVRSLSSLALSFALLVWVFIPLLLKGYDPVSLALLLGSAILFLSIFVAHGFSRQSTISFVGSMVSVILATIVVSWVTSVGSFSGITDHSALFLSQFAGQELNFVSLYAAAVIIGTLGVLDDITITQVAVVRELANASKIDRKEIFQRALRVGRDHISSLVNTLVFAYVGSALPLIMFMSQLDTPFAILMSQEFIAAEIFRALIGAIALVIAVPITTWCASYPFFHFIKKDKEALAVHDHDHGCHHHH